MATSEVDIYNLALSACGQTGDVALVSEASRGAELCNQWYDHVRDLVLSAAYWPSATTHQRLALTATRDTSVDWVVTDPAPGYIYAYSYPDNMLRPQFMSDFSRFSLTLINNAEMAINSNTPQPVLTYTVRQTNVGLWEIPLRDAVAHALGAHIVTELTGNKSRIQQLAQFANSKILEARANVANYEQDTYESVPPWLAIRGIGSDAVPERYYYPFGPLLVSVGGVNVNT